MAKLIPFKWLPGSWGLKGKAFQLAEAEYLYDGELLARHIVDIEYPMDDPKLVADREVKLAQIDYDYGQCTEMDRDERCLRATVSDEKTLAMALINLRHAHGLLDDYEHAKASAEVEFDDEVDREVALFNIDAEFGKIESSAAEKEIANLRNEPWVGGHAKIDDESGGFMFELDWNDQWIAQLRENGFDGPTDDIVMKKWFAALCYEEVMSSSPQGVDPFVYDIAREAFQNSQNDRI